MNHDFKFSGKALNISDDWTGAVVLVDGNPVTVGEDHDDFIGLVLDGEDTLVAKDMFPI